MNLDDLTQTWTTRVETKLDAVLPPADQLPFRLHEAMRYSVLGGGKRIRPLLVYATGVSLGATEAQLDAPAAAVELLHAFSLVHDDLPAMDDDDLRRGRATTHKAFDEATAILAADALQPLAFKVLASDTELDVPVATRLQMMNLLADACGSLGMTGGQAIDLESEGQQLSAAELEHMYRLKTGCLLEVSVLAGACAASALSGAAAGAPGDATSEQMRLMAAGAVCSSLKLAADRAKPTEYVVEQMLSGFRTLSAVLVTSTIAASLFFQMALAPFLTAAEVKDASGLAGYVGGLTTFWGAVFTLTLFAVYVGPMAVLYDQQRRAAEKDKPGDFMTLREWLAVNGVENGLSQRIKNVLILLAPMLVGPLRDVATTLAV